MTYSQLNIISASGARANISQNVIRIYDSSGNLRVRMGVWGEEPLKAIRIYLDDTFPLDLSEPSWCVEFNSRAMTEKQIKTIYDWIDKNCDPEEKNIVYSWGAQFGNKDDATLCYIAFR